jgi:K+/H+ antiporter YhaU regulatory subunit KhtT
MRMWWNLTDKNKEMEVLEEYAKRIDTILEDDMSSLFKRLTTIESKIDKLLNRRVRFKKGKSHASNTSMSKV